MSGGAITVLPAALVVLPLAAVAGAGLAAVLVARGAAAGTAATGRALECLGDRMARVADAQHDAALRTRLWELAAGAVVHVNQEMRLLAARAEQVGIRPDLPPFLDLTGCALADTRALVARAQDALARARAEVLRAEAERAQQVLLAGLAAPMGGGPTTAELLAGYKQALTLRWVNAAVGQPMPTQPADESWVHAEIEEILLRLDPDALAAERARAMEIAGMVVTRKGDIASCRTYLESLGELVDKKLNPVIGRRREAAGLLAGLTHPVAVEMIGDSAPSQPPLLDLIARLQEVVGGRRDLTEEDRLEARRGLDLVSEGHDRALLMAALTEAFAKLGYSVTAGLQVRDGGLSVTRASWHGEHSADVWIDRAGQVNTRLVQVVPGAVGEADRCAEWNTGIRQVGDELERHGMGTVVELPTRLVPALIRVDSMVVPDLIVDEKLKQRQLPGDQR